MSETVSETVSEMVSEMVSETVSEKETVLETTPTMVWATALATTTLQRWHHLLPMLWYLAMTTARATRPAVATTVMLSVAASETTWKMT
jgi:glycerol-3-phosphate dehydrogenase